MSKKLLKNVSMGRTWASYVAAAHGILTAAGMYDGDVSQLMGDCGIGFHFIVHKDVCPSSTTVYNWPEDHFRAMDRIGAHTDVVHFWNDGSLFTYPQIRAQAIMQIKSSIDEGRAVLIWAPTPILEFGIIHGYDDEDKVFYVIDCTSAQADPLLRLLISKHFLDEFVAGGAIAREPASSGQLRRGRFCLVRIASVKFGIAANAVCALAPMRR